MRFWGSVAHPYRKCNLNVLRKRYTVWHDVRMNQAPAYDADVGRKPGEPTSTRSFRLPDSLISRAEAVAKTEDRTLNNLVLRALREYVEAREEAARDADGH